MEAWLVLVHGVEDRLLGERDGRLVGGEKGEKGVTHVNGKDGTTH